jgi:trehalose 6-phosphate synthase
MPQIMPSSSRLVIVSNRLPFELESKEGQLTMQPGSGGLVTALAPVLKGRGGIWVGWPGGIGVEENAIRKALPEVEASYGFSFEPVFLTQEELDLYYYGFSNEAIWPLFHDLQTQCNFKPEYWQAYQKVNRKFADTLAEKLPNDTFIWVHDYHLMLVGQILRERGIKTKIGYFLHIPFPPLDIFLKLPWRSQVLPALLEYDLIGFQTARDCRNFLQCVRWMKKEVRFRNVKGVYVCKWPNRETRVGAFPISIDFHEFSDKSASPAIIDAAKELREKWGGGKLIMSLDRLDYTKGIVDRLSAIRLFLERNPEFHKQTTFIQIMIPSRTEIPQYQKLKQEIDQLVGEINSKFAQENWVPIHSFFRHLTRDELLSYYKMADLALVTPVKDGMNLVAKEYVACQIENKGALVLSEFAGSAAQLRRGALLVNPYDIEAMAEAIKIGLNLPLEEREWRMQAMRRIVKKYDIFWWMRTFLATAFACKLEDFPQTTANINLHVDPNPPG